MYVHAYDQIGKYMERAVPNGWPAVVEVDVHVDSDVRVLADVNGFSSFRQGRDYPGSGKNYFDGLNVKG
jgi:hypothetical protein